LQLYTRFIGGLFSKMAFFDHLGFRGNFFCYTVKKYEKIDDYYMFFICRQLPHWIMYKNVPKIYVTPANLGISCLDQKLPTKLKWSKNATILYLGYIGYR
jgi:hypothetical protein